MAETFEITHDTDDFSEYDSTVLDSGDLSTGTPGLASTTAKMEALIDDTTAIYGHKDFPQLASSAYRFRIYIDINSLDIPSNSNFSICQILNGANGRAAINLRRNFADTAYEIDAVAINDSAGGDDTGNYEISDALHYIEVLLEYASGAAANDGAITLWIDGVEKEELGGLDIFDISKPDGARLGATKNIPAGTAGTLYLDEFVLRDDDTEIGPVAAPSGALPMAMNLYRHRRT